MKNIFRKFFFEPTRLSQLYPKQKKKEEKINISFPKRTLQRYFCSF